ncbi:hypothetical protein GCM10009677_59340 [Sphaerisporangium rubeum]
MTTDTGGQTRVAGPGRGESGNSFMAALTLLYERVGTATHGGEYVRIGVRRWPLRGLDE